MNSSSLRKLSLSVRQGGFLDGLRAGLTATDFMFDPSLSKVRIDPASGPNLDREALRNDVQRAQADFAGRHTKQR